MRIDVYQQVTDSILAALERGVPPWRNPLINQPTATPMSVATGKPYRGINVFLLAVRAWSAGYDSGYWLTYRQCQAAGGQVKRGEKSTLVVFWKLLTKTDPATGEDRHLPVIRYYRVFNAAQCDGLPDGLVPDASDSGRRTRQFQPNHEAMGIIDGYPTARDIWVVGPRPCYRPRTDELFMPVPQDFESDEAWYGTFFHELVHATGHSSRLVRGLDTDLRPFGSPDYGKEELVAEMGAAFLCAQAGIAPVTLDNSAAYIDGWIKTIKGSPKLVVQAAGAAQRAADLILGVTFEEEPTD